ncbi:hypothetical protein [Moorena producens]|uniref:hypothetical protein n=1 Tax=Moorena producens TaxID=1155739 RepID=UPI003C791949
MLIGCSSIDALLEIAAILEMMGLPSGHATLLIFGHATRCSVRAATRSHSILFPTLFRFFLHRLRQIKNNNKFPIRHESFKRLQVTLGIRPVPVTTNNDPLHLWQ